MVGKQQLSSEFSGKHFYEKKDYYEYDGFNLRIPIFTTVFIYVVGILECAMLFV